MENQNEERTSAVGYFFFGKSYLDSAAFLKEGLEKQQLEIPFHAPVYHLFGRAFELFFKAIIRTNGTSTEQLKALGHNLERLATKAQKVADFESLVKDLDIAQKDYWRKIAKKERDDFLNSESPFNQAVKTQSNEEIDRSLPNFMQSLKLLNELYDTPYHTRYFERGSKTYPVFDALYIPALMLLDRAEEPC